MTLPPRRRPPADGERAVVLRWRKAGWSSNVRFCPVPILEMVGKIVALRFGPC